MKKTKLRLLLLLFFIGGLIILPQKANADEVEAVPVSISVKYGQTEARTILDMINEARTNSEHAWYWNKDDTTKTFCTDLKELEYDYDLERVAMKRAAEIALSYDHERPIGGYAWDTYGQENIRYSHAGENIAAAQTTASQVNFCWREDNEPYGGQGHRRNMLSSKFNCVGIGHVYYNGVHYWVEEFAYRPEINTTEVPANDSTQAVSVSVDKTKIKKVDVTYTCENCGETETVSTKKTKHDYREEQHKNATCTENGYSISVCQVCNDKKKEEIVAKGHSKGIRNKATATCKAEGYTGDTYCRTCKTLLEEGKILPKLEHQWNDGTVTKRATYETAGELTYRCRKCAAKRIISIEKLAYPKVGTSYTISGNEYKVSKPGAEVILVKTSKTTKNVTVPAQIYAQGITYKVTSIGAKAFNNNKNLTKVTIGTNIVKINRNAFFNCKNLKTVTIKSVYLTRKTANKKAFKNAHKKLVIRVPKKVKKIYKKIFKGLKVK